MVLMQEAEDQKLKIPGIKAEKVPQINLDSTLSELTLYDFYVEASQLGKEVAQTLDKNPLLPGAIITHQGKFMGMISRRRFLERMSRPYGLDLFLKRPLRALYGFTSTEMIILGADTPIVEAAQLSLRRPPELLYEPIIVKLGEDTYRLVDVHQLLIAQSKIHQLTTTLLEEQTHAHLVQTEKMASLGRMVAGVAHEIRNPVNCINGNLEFLDNYCQDIVKLLKEYQKELGDRSQDLQDLEEEIELDFLLDDLPQMLTSMEVAAKKLTEIVTSLRNFSRMEDRKKQLVDIHECIDSTLLILNNRIKHGINLEKSYTQLPPIVGYSGQMSQVFMNIISNSLDNLVETKENSPSKPPNWQPGIKITTQVREEKDTAWAVIQLEDNGSGIPPEIQEKIFEAFFTTKPVGKGTGLGLSISHQIITEKHQGKLNFYSQVNKGTKFEILLPVEAN